MDREITFRRIAAGHYRNHETGVEIVKTPRQRLGRHGWRAAGWAVTAPSISNGYISRSEVGFAATKTAAEVPATRIALNTREQTAANYAQAAAEYIDRAVAPYDDSDRDDDIRAYGWPQGKLWAARNEWHNGDFDRACMFAREAADWLADARARQIADAYDAAVGYVQRQADQKAWLAQNQPFAYRIRAFREATGCGLREGKAMAVAEAELLARLEDATRRRNEVDRIEEFADAAYLSAEYSRARQTRSDYSAQLVGRRAVIDAAHADALRECPDVYVPCGEPTTYHHPQHGYGVHTTPCQRPAGHDDAIGHAPVQYPAGTPEHADYTARLRAALADWVAQASDTRGMRMGPGHVAPATIAQAWDEALAEDAVRLSRRAGMTREEWRRSPNRVPNVALAERLAHEEAEAARPTATIIDIQSYGIYADQVRTAVNLRKTSRAVGVLALMHNLGVTAAGAEALLNAESTAALADMADGRTPLPPGLALERVPSPDGEARYRVRKS